MPRKLIEIEWSCDRCHMVSTSRVSLRAKPKPFKCECGRSNSYLNVMKEWFGSENIIHIIMGFPNVRLVTGGIFAADPSTVLQKDVDVFYDSVELCNVSAKVARRIILNKGLTYVVRGYEADYCVILSEKPKKIHSSCEDVSGFRYGTPMFSFPADKKIIFALDH